MNGTEKVKRVRTTEIPAHLGQRVRVQGWMQTLRLLGGINFVIVRDGWGTVQAVTEDIVLRIARTARSPGFRS